MNARDLTGLVHLIGFAAGILLYGMLGAMTRRRLAYVDAPSEHREGDRLPMFAALLGVIWNAGAMLVYTTRDFGIGEPWPWVGAISYTALGFLPAVVVHSTLDRDRRLEHRWLLAIAYAASTIAGVLHAAAAMRGEVRSSAGLLLLTITYAGILVALALTQRGRPNFQRSIAAVALAAFAVSALHLSRQGGAVDQAPWPIELIGHHASLPLVLAMLYQDYRFAFADLFLKRALSLIALMAVAALLYAVFAAPLVDPHAIIARGEPRDDEHLLSTGILLGLWIATALAYPFIQRRIHRFVDRVVLRRADYPELRAELAVRLSSAHDADEALSAACELLARALDAPNAVWRTAGAPPAPGQATIVLDAKGTRACVVIATAIAPSYEIDLGEVRAGRAMLSDDLMLVDAVAASVGRRIDELRLESEREARQQREREVLRLATEAELRALRAQLNPHFLFNALNTLGHLMQAAPDRALTTLYRLTALLRAVLRRTNGAFVPLSEELEIVESYLAIEHERFQERLEVVIEVPVELREARVPPLILQPLVENAVKHGIAPLRQGGTVIVRAERDVSVDDHAGFLRLYVIDTGRGMPPISSVVNGIGLANVQSRLEHYYGAAALMSIRATPGGGATVEVCIPWAAPVGGELAAAGV